MGSSAIKPSLISLVLCDNVYHESTGKQALVGLFNFINVPQLPALRSRMCIFASFTGARPGTQIRISIVHSESEEELVTINGKMQDATISPLAVHDMVFVLDNVLFKEPGRHEIQLWGNDHPLGIRPFIVALPKQHKEPTP